MSKNVLFWGRCLACLAVYGLVLGRFAFAPHVALGDSDNPPPPAVPGNPGLPSNTKGPCTDPHTWTSSGVGNGICGRCGNMVFTYTGGSCAGTSNSGCPDCRNYVLSPAVFTWPFTSVPVGSLEYACCLSAYVACLGADGILSGGICGPACTVGGVFTLGASCIACIAGASLGAAACTCMYDECKEDCVGGSVTTAGTAGACY
jgi:hypothetical protein